ncbi:hypothetical protein DCAR_0205390 [Daucus carota subsp. sativus]|uniref:Uncharacterized protein n=1 Tax=Daucus carota subsp. sativus TaxID=79200 RepID=A0AAF1AK52_DAUCS|nr:hypothetical protein DCAR_0205390 [Daucus carota subsp. sativus]
MIACSSWDFFKAHKSSKLAAIMFILFLVFNISHLLTAEMVKKESAYKIL